MADQLKRGGAHWMLPIPVRVLVAESDKQLTRALQRRFSPLCKFEIAHTLREANMRMGLASTPFDAFIIDIELPDGNGLEWFRELKTHGELGRATILAPPEDDDELAVAAAASGAALIRKTGSGEWLAAGLRTFLERVATEHILRTLLRRYANERSFSDAEQEVFESALWVRRALVPPLMDKEDSTVKSQVTSMNRRTGLHSVEAAIIAALVRGILESLNGGLDDG